MTQVAGYAGYRLHRLHWLQVTQITLVTQVTGYTGCWLRRSHRLRSLHRIHRLQVTLVTGAPMEYNAAASKNEKKKPNAKGWSSGSDSDWDSS